MIAWPGLPTAWRGPPVQEAAFDGGVAVLGDLHGRTDLLDRLLPRLAGRALVFVGDLGDRGADTRGVIDRLLARRAIGVLGNHDVWLATWAADEGLDPYVVALGGTSTLASYGCTVDDAPAACVPAAHRELLLGLPVALDLTVAGVRWWVVHGGIPSDLPFEGRSAAEIVPWLARERPEELLWRKTDPEAMVPLDRPLVMGHRPRRAPLDTGDVVAIDTGAGKATGRLTALLLPERRFVTVG